MEFTQVADNTFEAVLNFSLACRFTFWLNPSCHVFDFGLYDIDLI